MRRPRDQTGAIQATSEVGTQDLQKWHAEQVVSEAEKAWSTSSKERLALWLAAFRHNDQRSATEKVEDLATCVVCERAILGDLTHLDRFDLEHLFPASARPAEVKLAALKDLAAPKQPPPSRVETIDSNVPLEIYFDIESMTPERAVLVIEALSRMVGEPLEIVSMTPVPTDPLRYQVHLSRRAA